MNNNEYWYFSGYRDAVIACIELLFGERGPVPSRKELERVLKNFRRSKDRKGLVKLFGNKR